MYCMLFAPPMDVHNCLCSVKHLLVRTKSELQYALWSSQKGEDDCVIEVESSIAENSIFHGFYPLACSFKFFFVKVIKLS